MKIGSTLVARPEPGGGTVGLVGAADRSAQGRHDAETLDIFACEVRSAERLRLVAADLHEEPRSFTSLARIRPRIVWAVDLVDLEANRKAVGTRRPVDERVFGEVARPRVNRVTDRIAALTLEIPGLGNGTDPEPAGSRRDWRRIIQNRPPLPLRGNWAPGGEPSGAGTGHF